MQLVSFVVIRGVGDINGLAIGQVPEMSTIHCPVVAMKPQGIRRL